MASNPTMPVMSGKRLDTVCRAICQSWAFETGEGTCAVLCMEGLGSVRKDCAHKVRIHGRMGRKILEALAEDRKTSCHPEQESACAEPFHVDDGVPYCDTCGVFRQSKVSK